MKKISKLPATQKSIHTWHRQRHPKATVKDIALKFAEEAGEVVAAVNKRNDANLYEEIGDALICLNALAARKGWSMKTILRERMVNVFAR